MVEENQEESQEELTELQKIRQTLDEVKQVRDEVSKIRTEIAQDALGGRTIARQAEPEKKEESPEDYAQRVLSGDVGDGAESA